MFRRQAINRAGRCVYAPAMTDRKICRWVGALLLIAWPAVLHAHGDEIAPGASWWTLWQWSPEILIGLGLALLVYLRGLIRGARPPALHILAYCGGLLALFAGLISPIEPLADHIFAVHQVEHMCLRTLGPMLIFASLPQAVLMRGLPRALRQRLAGPVASNGPVRRLFGFLTRPFIVTGLFLFVSYFWMVPHWHDLAILDEPIHYLWHISLLVTGLLFFSVMFDRRRPPLGASLGERLIMFVLAALGNILLGAFLTFKPMAIYTAYLHMGHLWHVPMVIDESTGGAIMWMPGTMMFALSAGIIIHRWAKEETRGDARRQREARPAPARAASANGRLALGLAGFSLMMLLIAFTAAETIHRMDEYRLPGAAHTIP